MEDKYLPSVGQRKELVLTQIGECQTLIYRNNLENLTFKANGDKHKQVEVETNKEILKEKIDLLLTELQNLESLSANPNSGSTAVEGTVI